MDLYCCKTNQEYLLKSCPADHLLKAIGVRTGLVVKIVSKQPMNGPIVIRINERDIAIDKTIATAILTEAVV